MTRQPRGRPRIRRYSRLGSDPTATPEHECPPSHTPAPPEDERKELLLSSSTFLTTLLAVPALVLSLITYFDTRGQKREEDVKEAAQISWHWGLDGEKYPAYITLENRSLRPIYDALIEQPRMDHTLYFYIDEVVGGCSRVTYTLIDHRKDIGSNEEVPDGRILFRDALNAWWWSGYKEGLNKFDEKADVKQKRNWSLLQRWHLQPNHELLPSGCG